MKEANALRVPRARKGNLVVQELADEVLIYDQDSHKAHCLNHTAALIWKNCDGRRSVTDLARKVAQELQTPVSEDVVWFALDQLEKDQLLEEPLARPAGVPKMSRRALMRRVGVAAAVASIPVVTSIVAPTVLANVSCRTPSGGCDSMNPCPSGCICSGGTCVPA